MLASFTGVDEGSELCWLPGSTSGAGRNLGTGKKALEISTGVGSRRAIMTRLPICVMPQNCCANPSGSLMQPCEAGWPGTTPKCIATPDHVMRCINGIGAPL